MRVSAAARQSLTVRDPPDRALSVGLAAATRPRNLAILLAGAALAGAVGAAGMSAAAVVMVATALLGFALLIARDSIDFELARGGRSLRPEVDPTELAAELAHLCAELARAHERVRRMLRASSDAVDHLRDLEWRAASINDPAAARAFERAASARRRELETRGQIEGLHACVDVLTASLASVEALIIERQAGDSR